MVKPCCEHLMIKSKFKVNEIALLILLKKNVHPQHYGNPNYREPIYLSCILKPNCQINALYQNKKLPKTVHDVLSVNKAVIY